MINLSDIIASIQPGGSVALALPPTREDGHFQQAVIDSRLVSRGDLFVALPGEHVDGHAFVADALRRGARGALVRREWAEQQHAQLDPPAAPITDIGTLAQAQPEQALLFAADDPLVALQQLSAHHRARMPAQVIGITGSVGKTSTKELAAGVLRRRFRTLHSGKSYNNEIGVPLTLLRLTPEHEVAVVEMGTYGPGEIALLCRLAQPQIGIVTNVGVSHLERMRTPETVAIAKRELVEALPPEGVAILNIDDPRVRAMALDTCARSFFYGLDPRADLWADAIESHGLDGISFTAHHAGQTRRLRLPALGRHAVYVALPAIAAGLMLGMHWDEIAAGLADGGVQSRIVALRGTADTLLLDDTYNASPVSCRAALELLDDLSQPSQARRIAVFGDMAELGPIEEQGHRDVGRAAATTTDLLLAVGEKARWIGEEALAQSQPPQVIFARTNAEAIAALRPLLKPGDIVLVKGARVARTEEIISALREVEGVS